MTTDVNSTTKSEVKQTSVLRAWMVGDTAHTHYGGKLNCAGRRTLTEDDLLALNAHAEALFACGYASGIIDEKLATMWGGTFKCEDDWAELTGTTNVKRQKKVDVPTEQWQKHIELSIKVLEAYNAERDKKLNN